MSVSITFEGNKDERLILNLANSNFATLWRALELKTGCGWGEVDGRLIQRQLKSTPVDAVVRLPSQDELVVDCGLERSQVARYMAILSLIAIEAEKRERQIVWH